MPSCLPNDQTQNLVIRTYTKTDSHMLDNHFSSSFSEMIAGNVFAFCRDLYQNRLRSFSIAYVFTRYLEDLTSNSLRKKVLNLARNVIINLTSKFDGEETHSGDSNNNTKNKSFLIDELKLGFFFQHSPAHQRTLRQVIFQRVKII